MSLLWRRAVVATLAVGLDLLVGDPPNEVHPVAWLGRAIGWAQKHAPKEGRLAPLAYGGALVATGAMGVGRLGHGLELLVSALPGGLGIFAEAAALKSVLAVNGLEGAALEIQRALVSVDLAEARHLLSWHLVSRDTSSLDASQVSAATIESVAENTSDGVIGPLCFYVLFGLPGACVYRFVNTCDSMLGYRDAAREWLGKVPARLDDLVNLLPARVTAELFVSAASLLGEDAARARQVRTRDAGTTASPNAGHPMSAMAGALGVELEKVGHYRLGDGLRRPETRDIGRSVRVMRVAAGLGLGALLVLGLATRRRGIRS